MAAGTGECSGERLRGSGSGKHGSGLNAEQAGVASLDSWCATTGVNGYSTTSLVVLRCRCIGLVAAYVVGVLQTTAEGKLRSAATG